MHSLTENKMEAVLRWNLSIFFFSSLGIFILTRDNCCKTYAESRRYCEFFDPVKSSFGGEYQLYSLTLSLLEGAQTNCKVFASPYSSRRDCVSVL
ncbi:hypothetical protein FKM82_025565 [Ascaphus truei]